MLLVILSRFSLDRKRLRSLLDDEVNFAVLGLVEVAQIEAVGRQLLGDGVLQHAAPVHRKVPLQKVESCIARRLRGQKPHVTEKEFEQIVLGVQRQRQLRRFNVVAGQPHAGVSNPHEITRIALHAGALRQITELEALVLLVEFLGNSIEDHLDVGPIVPVFGDILPIQVDDILLHSQHV